MANKKIVKAPKVKVVKKIGRPVTLPGFWGEFAKAAGGVGALSGEIGRSVRQIRRIANHESPLMGATRVAAMAIASKYKMERALEEWERAGA